MCLQKYIWAWNTAFVFKTERREPTWEFPSSFLPLWRFSETELRTMWNIYLWPKNLLSAVSSITDMLQGISPDNIFVAELCYKSLFFPHPLCSPAVEPALHSSGLLGKRSCSSILPGSRCRAHLYAEFLSCHRHVSIHNTWDCMGNLLTCQLNSWMTFACGRDLTSKRWKWQIILSACCTWSFIFTCSEIDHVFLL